MTRRTFVITKRVLMTLSIVLSLSLIVYLEVTSPEDTNTHTEGDIDFAALDG